MLAAASRNTSRLEGFSDAVFAFAATLLVVSLEVPRDFDALVSELYGFAAFAITFGALVAIWTIHRACYRRYELSDGWTVLFNSGASEVDRRQPASQVASDRESPRAP
jgi:uncharacterized membrane protein